MRKLVFVFFSSIMMTCLVSVAAFAGTMHLYRGEDIDFEIENGTTTQGDRINQRVALRFNQYYDSDIVAKIPASHHAKFVGFLPNLPMSGSGIDPNTRYVYPGRSRTEKIQIGTDHRGRPLFGFIHLKHRGTYLGSQFLALPEKTRARIFLRGIAPVAAVGALAGVASTVQASDVRRQVGTEPRPLTVDGSNISASSELDEIVQTQQGSPSSRTSLLAR